MIEVTSNEDEKEIATKIEEAAEYVVSSEEKSYLQFWAEREIELVIADKVSEPFDEYYNMCARSALDAFTVLTKAGHSGASINVTQTILNRLISKKPLTPITDNEEEWTFAGDYCDREEERNYKSYHAKRCPSLFKDVYEDGTVKYTDVNRVYCISRENPTVTYRSSFCTNIFNEMFPITLPYMPSDEDYEMMCTECLTDRKNGDFDAMGLLYVTTPKGERVTINRYFKDDGDTFAEITAYEYQVCQAMSEARIKAEAMDREDDINEN